MEIVLFKYIWILFILVSLFNVYQLKNKFRPYIDEKPEREPGYNLILKNYLIYSLIPWIIIGIGNLSGRTSNVFDYFQPAKLNPYVLAFHVSIIVIWLLVVRFIFFNNGAEFLENHPGVIQFRVAGRTKDNLSQNTIKLLTALMLAGGMIAMIVMWNVDINSPF
jgi:hypothetical protein